MLLTGSKYQKSKLGTNMVFKLPMFVSSSGCSISKVEKLREARNTFMEHLQRLGISTRPATHAVHMLEYYKQKYKLEPSDFPNAFLEMIQHLSSLFNGMSEKEQQYVIDHKRLQILMCGIVGLVNYDSKQ